MNASIKTTRKLRVLVVDDNPVHLKAAEQTLADCELTTCSTHDEAHELLLPKYDEEKRDLLYKKYMGESLSSNEFWERVCEESRFPYWDAVLCDLLMPAGERAQGDQGLRFVGQEMAIGWGLALNAVENGAKYVAVVTDMDHHDHPASALLDNVSEHVFQMDNSRILFTNNVGMVGIKGTEDSCQKCSGTKELSRHDGTKYPCYSCGGTGTDFAEKGKDWGDVLTKLTGQTNPAG